MEGDSLVEEGLVVGGYVLEMLEAHADVVTLVPEVIRIKLPWINSEDSLSFINFSMVFLVQLNLLLAQCSALGESGLQPHLGHLLLFSLGQTVNLVLLPPHVRFSHGLGQQSGQVFF